MQRLIASMALGLVVSAGTCARYGWGQSAAPEQAPAALAPAPVQSAATVAAGGTIRGTAKAGNVPLPGVGITATNTLTGKKYATTTDITGAFAMAIPRNGRYVVKAELAAFASDTKEVLINAAGQNGGKPEQVVEFGLQLASRVAQQQQQQQAAAAGTAAGNLAGALGRGTQSLNVTGDASEATDASAGSGNAGAQMPTLAGLGGGDATATDSVAVSGQVGQTNGLANFSEDDIRQRVQDAIANAQRQGGAVGDMANAVAGMLGGMMVAGPGWVWRRPWGRRWQWGLSGTGWRGRRRWRRIQEIESDAAAWNCVLSGGQWGVECGAVLGGSGTGRGRRAGGEALVDAEPVWRELNGIAVDSRAVQGESEAVCVCECDRDEEHQPTDL